MAVTHRAVGIACLVLLLVPLAAAQAPQGSGVAVTSETSEVTVSIERSTNVVVTVAHTAGDEAPLLPDRRFFVQVEDLPEGWQASAEPAMLTIAAGESKTSTVRISVTADADAQSAAVRVVATMQPLGFSGSPLTGSQADPEASDSVTIEAQRQESFTRTVLESLDPWIYLLFLALLLAIVVAVKFAVDRRGRQTRLRLAASATEVTVRPGGRASVPIHVENAGREEDTVLFQVSVVEEGWAAFLPLTDIQLKGGQREDVNLVIVAPDDAKTGHVQAVLVSAQSARTAGRPENVTIEARVQAKGN